MTNLLYNPTFDPSVGRGEWQKADNIFLPDGWDIGYKDGEPFDGIHDDPDWLVAHRPEAVILNEWMGIDDPFWPDDDSYVLKIFVQNCLYTYLLPQKPLDLEAGTYTFEVTVWPKLHMLNSERNHPDDPNAGEVGLQVNGGEIHWVSDLAYDAYNNLSWVFDHEGGDLNLRLYMKGKYPIDNSFFLYNVGLYEEGAVVEEPSLDVVQPREEYDRTYVLMPPDADFDMACAALDATWNTNRFTVGGSADDAGFGLRDHRKVIIVNPESWEDDIVAFFHEHYAGIEIDEVRGETPRDLYLAFLDYISEDDDDDEGGNTPSSELYEVVDVDLRRALPTRDDYENMAMGLENGWYQRTLKEIDGMTIHHLAGTFTPEQVARYHINEKSYGPTPSIHYHLWITREGKILQVNDLENGVWHDHTGHKNTHLAVVLEGDLNVEYPTDAQLSALVKVARYFINDERFSITKESVKGHNDYAHTTCPGWDMSGWREDFYKRLNGGDPKLSVAGVHSPINVMPVEDVQDTAMRLQDMGMRYYKLLFDGTLRDYGQDQRDMVKALVDAGIQPVVRLYDARQAPHRNRVITERFQALHDLVSAFGYKDALVEVSNEPNLPGEWADGYDVSWQNDDLITELAESWYEDAMALLHVGAQPAIPAMAPTDRGAINDKYSGVMWLIRFVEYLGQHHRDIEPYLYDGRIWAASHSAAFTRPFDFDPFRPDGHVDDMCLRSYEIVKQVVYNIFDVYPRVISTEGGVYSPQHMHQIGWSDNPERVMLEGTDQVYYDKYSWGKKVVECFDFLRTQDRPMRLDGMCMWHFSDEGSAAEWHGNGWHGEGWVPRSPVSELLRYRLPRI